MINIYGTSYRLHPLFIALMVLSVWTGYFAELITLFGIVIIHELGHVAAAKHYGWSVSSVQLLPIGGVAVVDDDGAATSGQEIVVALAGPLQNALMIGAALLLHKAGIWGSEWTDYWVKANVWIGLFNLLPLMPLDGGRIMQALLSRYTAYYRALSVSIWLSLAGSMVWLAVVAVQSWRGRVDLNMLAIGLFLLFTGLYALRDVYYRFLRFLVHRKQRTERMLRRGQPVHPIAVREAYDSITIAKLLRREKYHVIYIMDRKGISRVLPEERLVEQLLSPQNKDDDLNHFMLK